MTGQAGAGAETLRRAALLMRERAEGAGDHQIEQTLLRGVIRCSCGESSVGDPRWRDTHLAAGLSWQLSADYATQIWDDRERLVASAEGLAEAEHIASWHPGVAVAVADLLDTLSRGINPDHRTLNAAALAVARAYLGEQP